MKHLEFYEALELLGHIQTENKAKYGECNLIVPIDTHNVAVVKLLTGERDVALILFHEAVLLRKDLIEDKNTLVPVSFLGILRSSTESTIF